VLARLAFAVAEHKHLRHLPGQFFRARLRCRHLVAAAVFWPHAQFFFLFTILLLPTTRFPNRTQGERKSSVDFSYKSNLISFNFQHFSSNLPTQWLVVCLAPQRFFSLPTCSSSFVSLGPRIGAWVVQKSSRRWPSDGGTFRFGLHPGIWDGWSSRRQS
jgi:hypothetical protein